MISDLRISAVLNKGAYVMLCSLERLLQVKIALSLVPANATRNGAYRLPLENLALSYLLQISLFQSA